MRATPLIHERLQHSERSFVELVLWELPLPIAGSSHPYKYRLAYVVNSNCVLRYDNEVGKGDHRHINRRQSDYKFSTPQRLLADFFSDIARWDHENSDL